MPHGGQHDVVPDAVGVGGLVDAAEAGTEAEIVDLGERAAEFERITQRYGKVTGKNAKIYSTAKTGIFGASTGSPYRAKNLAAAAAQKSEADAAAVTSTPPLAGTPGHWYVVTGLAAELVSLPSGHQIWRVPR